VPSKTSDANLSFEDAVKGLLHGDFSRLDPLFCDPAPDVACPVIQWHLQGRFDDEPKALAEALSCACFKGKTNVVAYLLDHGVDLMEGNATGMNGVHWAVNRGQLDTVRLLIERRAPLETKSMYDTTVLRTAIWSAINEAKPDHLAIIEALVRGGADLAGTGHPTGHAGVVEVLRRFGAGR
jgi:hypothetical protein